MKTFTKLVLTLVTALVLAACSIFEGSPLFPGGQPEAAAPEAPAGEAPAPEGESAPAEQPAVTGGTQVPYLNWTPWVLDNVVIDDAVHVRPSKPYEGTIAVDVSKVYQVKTDYDDSDPSTWKPGQRLYKYHVPGGYRAFVLGHQGDTAVRLCMAEEDGINVLWLQTQNGNGTSALVRFAKTSENPQPGALCQ